MGLDKPQAKIEPENRFVFACVAAIQASFPLAIENLRYFRCRFIPNELPAAPTGIAGRENMLNRAAEDCDRIRAGINRRTLA